MGALMAYSSRERSAAGFNALVMLGISCVLGYDIGSYGGLIVAVAAFFMGVSAESDCQQASNSDKGPSAERELR